MINDSKIYDDVDILLPEDISGWNSDNRIFEYLIEKVAPKIIVEVGTWKGASAINMARCVKKFNMDTHIYCVDTWLGTVEFWTDPTRANDRNSFLKNGYPQIYYQFLSNVIHANNQDIITPIPLPSNMAYKILQYHNIKADMIYIDASHEYEDVLNDIKNYEKILNDGGIMFGDDYNSFEGVRKAVDESLSNSFTLFDNHFWVYKKI